MNHDECRKELKPCPFCGGEAFLNQPSRHEFTVTCKKFCVKLPATGGYTSLDNAITAWNSRTESKPVTREVSWNEKRSQVNRLVKELQGKPESEKMGYSVHPGGILNAYREGDLSFPEAVRAIESIQLSAPQPPAVTLELQAPQSKVTRDELFTLLSAGVMAHKPELREQDGRYELDFSPTIGPLASDMMRFLEAKMMSAPQSPVVPGVEKLDQLYDEIMLATDANASTVIGWAHRIKAIHAHLLATSGHSSCVDLGWIRSLLLNMKPSEIDDTAKLIFDTIATVGRQSREDQYREALERLRSLVALEEALIGLSPNMANALEMIRGALATTSPNDGSGRG